MDKTDLVVVGWFGLLFTMLVVTSNIIRIDTQATEELFNELGLVIIDKGTQHYVLANYTSFDSFLYLINKYNITHVQKVDWKINSLSTVTRYVIKTPEGVFMISGTEISRRRGI